MSTVVIEHVKVSELPEAWRTKLLADENTRVTVRIEAEVATGDDAADSTFGMWRDRREMDDPVEYVRRLRQPRY